MSRGRTPTADRLLASRMGASRTLCSGLSNVMVAVSNRARLVPLNQVGVKKIDMEVFRLAEDLAR